MILLIMLILAMMESNVDDIENFKDGAFLEQMNKIPKHVTLTLVSILYLRADI